MGSGGPVAGAVPDARDLAIVRCQLGREPRGRWRVAVRCRHGYPQVLVTPPVLEDDTPFPTLYWLTCPFLTAAASSRESEGEVARWAARLEADDLLAERMLDSDTRYREARAAEAAPDPDPCVRVGIAGQHDPLATKCLHAHVAAALAALGDPVGEAVLASAGHACDDVRCAACDPGLAGQEGTT